MVASKNRFAPELNEKEVIELIENTTPGSIKKATKYVMKIFQGKNFKTLFWQIKDGAYFCYCAYVLRISRYSDFLSPMLTNTGIFLRGLKLSGESRP